VCLYVLYRIIVPIQRTWRALDGPAVPTDEQVKVARGKVMRLPVWAIGIACVGWLPGGLVFPIVIDATAGPLDPHVFGHFVVSFSISGLIALTYSLFAIQYWGLRVLYPRLWVDAHHLREQAAAELVTLQRRLRVFQTLAGIIPLAGAIQMIAAGPEQFSQTGYAAFRILVTALIAMGMMGFSAALTVSRLLQDTLTTLIGSDRQRHVRLKEFRRTGQETLVFRERPSSARDSSALRPNLSNLSSLPSEVSAPPEEATGGTG
jgi:hypothetical protein